MGIAFRAVWVMIMAQFLSFLSSTDPTNCVYSLQAHPAKVVRDLGQWHSAHISAVFGTTSLSTEHPKIKKLKSPPSVHCFNPDATAS